ncbi:hypothetical protein [Streptomyces sp. NPDC087294]|uniref:hypothetical protein n=1 Tax=Streptomyces sp. NPDC087294 TaxID=3365777 RepID=UPI00382DC37C
MPTLLRTPRTPPVRPTRHAHVLVEHLRRLTSAAYRPRQPAATASQLELQAAIVEITAQVANGARLLAGLAADTAPHTATGQNSALLDAAAVLHDALPSLCAAAVTTVDVSTTTPLTVTTLPH